MPTQSVYRAPLLFAVACSLLLTGCSNKTPEQRAQQEAASEHEADRQYNLGNVAQGRVWIQHAVDSNPDSIDTYTASIPPVIPGAVGVAAILIEHGDYDDTVTVLGTALKNPKITDAWALGSDYGDALYRLGRKAESQAAFRDLAAALAKSFPTPGASTPLGDSVKLLMAEAEWRSGNRAQAKTDFDTVRRFNPDAAANVDNDEAYNEAQDGVNLPEALSLANTAVTAASAHDDDTYSETEDTLGWVYYQMWLQDHSRQHLDEAISYLEDATGGMPGEADIHFHLASAYEAAGETTDAMAEYGKVLDLHPTDSFARAEMDKLGAVKPAAASVASNSSAATPQPLVRN